MFVFFSYTYLHNIDGDYLCGAGMLFGGKKRGDTWKGIVVLGGSLS